MKQKILEVKNLSVSFEHEVVLENISFSVYKSDITVILGPNGAGKSTLLRALAGLVPYSGMVTWHTKNIGYLPPQELILRKNLPPLTVLDFFLLQEVSNIKAQQAIEHVGLHKDILHEHFETISTGQFQRIMIAWVLIDVPDVLLLDEPISGIDIAGKETVYSLLHSLWKQTGITIILVTHDVSFVWEHAKTIICLDKKIICQGTPEQTLHADVLKKLYGTEVILDEHRHT